MRYINSYENDAAIQAAVDNGELGKPYVALNTERDEIDWNSKEKDYSKMPLTFEITSGTGTLVAKSNATANVTYPIVFEYSKNGGEWTEITVTTSFTETVISSVNAGDIIEFRGNNKSYGDGINPQYGMSIYSREDYGIRYIVYGNIMSMVNKDNYSTYNTISKGAFPKFFTSTSNQTPQITSVKNLVLPATTLAEYCYNNMFYGCININYIKCLATNISARNCTLNWVLGVSPTGTFVKKAGVNWSTGYSGIPSGWTVVEE